jgi:hypothetical protein
MKHVKMLGLVAMALAAFMALAGTASATSLTSPAGTTYTSTIKAEQAETITLTSAFGSFGAISCKKSTVEGSVEGHGASVTVTGKITKLTFTECTGGTPESPVAKPGSLELHTKEAASNGNGTLTSKSAVVPVTGTLLGNCTFTTKETGTDIGTLTGSTTTNAVLDISAVIESTSCGNGTWEGKYKVTTPSTLYVH